MIEIKSNPSEESYKNTEFYINGIKFSYPEINANTFFWEKNKNKPKVKAFQFSTRNPKAITEFTSHSLADLPYPFEFISFHYDDHLENVSAIYLSPKYYWDGDKSMDLRNRNIVYIEGKYTITFTISFDLTKWKNTYDIREYYYWFYKAAENYPNPNFEVGLFDAEESERGRFDVNFDLDFSNIPLATEIQKRILIIKQLNVEASESIFLASQKQNSVALNIEVPDEIRVPYEQYLIYFSEFLKDLGVQATSELHHTAKNILYTVTPADSTEALDKIRAVLEIYLRFPNSPITNYLEDETSVEIQKLSANVNHLKSQLSLAKAQLRLNEALIEAKDVTIQALRFTVSEQKQLIEGDISKGIINITPRSEAKDLDKEDLIKGIVSLTKYEGQGFEVNFAEIFRRLKEFLKPK